MDTPRYYGRRETCAMCGGAGWVRYLEEYLPADCLWCHGKGSRLMCVSAFNGCEYSLNALAQNERLAQYIARKGG